MRTQRFWWDATWHNTRWGFMWKERYFLPTRGGDEWHNDSWFIVLPLLGQFIWFPKRSFDRSGPEHVFYYGPDGFEGQIYTDCDSCMEFVDEVNEGRDDVR